MKHLTPIDRMRDVVAVADVLAQLGEDYAVVLDATAELPATDRERARQKRRGLYLRLLRQTLRTTVLLKDGERC
jgi:gamma-glutamyl:cysteine ligase YbdK (ATP-grasp superfamily)